jgi:hypothetical protein
MEENNFVEGLVMDSPLYQTKNTVLTDALNIRLLTMDGNEYILQTIDGNKITGETNSLLKDDYVSIGVKVYAGIAYIISALFNNGVFVSGEIGTYPSPNYNNAFINPNGNWEGSIIYEYKPLQNFKSDYISGGEALLTIGDFNSSLFNFDINHPVYDIEIQNSYDDTVNVIFTDFFNVPRLINTRIAFRGNRYEIINRRGVDSNIYNNESFQTTMKLQQQSRKIVNVEFALHGSGELQAGNYSYYFYYESEEGFRTPIKFQSQQIFVYDGTSVNSIKGLGRNNVTSEYLKTTKSNILALSNLDTQFPYLRVIYTYTSGQVGEVTVTRLIDKRITFSEYLEFEHFGIETYQNLQLEELNLLDASIVRARTITQLNNRLFLGNIEQRTYPIENLELFTSKIIVNQRIKQVGIELDTNEDFRKLYNPINFSTIVNQSHANSKCLYYRLGYWAEESYILGVIYIMNDGSESPVILLPAKDLLSTNTNLPKGLFRTRQRGIGLVNTPTAETANHIYLELDFNQAINEVGLPTDTIGFKVVRSRRNRNAITQGYVVNTVPVPLADYLAFDTDGQTLESYGDRTPYKVTGGRNAKLIPTPGFQFEAAMAREGEGDGNKSDDKKQSGVYAGIFNGIHYIGAKNGELFDYDKRYFAFYSTDVIVKEEEYAKRFSANDFKIKYLHQLDTINSIRARSVVENGSDGEDNFNIMTCHKPYRYNFTNTSVSNIKADYCYGHLDQTNLSGFTSVVKTNLLSNTDFLNGSEGSNNDFLELRATYNGYVGIVHETDKTLYNSITERNNAVDNSDVTMVAYESMNNTSPYVAAFKGRNYNQLQQRQIIEIANIYDSGGIRDSAQLNSIYNVDTEVFSPITNTIYWNRAKADETKASYIYGTAQFLFDGQVDGLITNTYDKTLEARSNVLEVFGGDCFIGLCFRKVDMNQAQRDDTTIGGYDMNIGNYLCIVTESNENPYLRNEELFDINEEGNRSFAPIYTTNQNYQNALTVFNKGNSNHNWRFYRQPETDGYNRGYGTTETFKTYLYTLNVPFVRNKFNTRIYYSDLFVNNGFDNAYRYIQAASYKDYNIHLGAIVRIIGRDNGLVCVHENGIELIPISQRTIINNDGTTAGQIFVDSIGILPEPSNTSIITDEYGSMWQGSIIKTDNTIYGVDVERERVWRINNGLELISEFAVQKWINSYFNQYKGQIPIIANRDVKTYFDIKTKDVWFVFYNQTITDCDECGTVFFQNLEKYANGVSTGLIVKNEESNLNYIAPFSGTCPYPNQTPSGNICGINQAKINNLCINDNILILNYRNNNAGANAIDSAIIEINPANYGLLNQQHFYNGLQVILPQPKTNGTVVLLDVSNPNLCLTESRWTSNMNPSKTIIAKEYTDEYVYSGRLNLISSSINYTTKTFTIGLEWIWKNLTYAQLQFDDVLYNASDLFVTITSPNGQVFTLSMIGTEINYYTRQDLLSYVYGVSGIYTIRIELYHRLIPIKIGIDFDYNNCLEPLICDSENNCWCEKPTIIDMKSKESVLMGDYTFYVTIPSVINNEEWLGRDAKCVNVDVKGLTIQFNERLNKWVTFTSCEPIEMFNLFDRLHSFSLKNSEQIWEHHQDNFSNFYGVQYKSYFDYVVGADSIGVAKMFDNMEIISNDERPEQIVINTDKEINLTQNIVPRISNSIILANQDYRESYHYITIGKNVINTPTTYQRVRDKYAKFRVIYNGARQFIIRGIKTLIRQSYA